MGLAMAKPSQTALSLQFGQSRALNMGHGKVKGFKPSLKNNRWLLAQVNLKRLASGASCNESLPWRFECNAKPEYILRTV